VANIKSQKKRNLTNEKARLRNNAYKSELKTLVRRVDEAVSASDKETAQDALRVVSRKLDKAVSKGVLHKNNAANKKSGLAKLVAKIGMVNDYNIIPNGFAVSINPTETDTRFAAMTTGALGWGYLPTPSGMLGLLSFEHLSFPCPFNASLSSLAIPD
jgi:small subunit ribosomal protein S20